MTSKKALIIAAQQKWAEASRQYKTLVSPTEKETSEKTYVEKLDDNLHLRLSDNTRREFEDGNGNELYAIRPKMQALHSSSALTVNFFEYWRSKDKSLLLKAIKKATGNKELKRIRTIKDIKFEQKFDTGNSSKANIDVVLTCLREDNTELLVAIESKFTEFYESHNELPKSYMSKVKWEGFENIRTIAEKEVSKSTREYKRLDVPQLIKHSLGLRKFGKDFILMLVWFDPFPENENRDMREDLQKFEDSVKRDILFTHTTYQDIFEAFEEYDDEEYQGYYEYLESRYFYELVS